MRMMGRVMQRWMGHAAKQQANRINAMLSPPVVKSLNTGMTCEARREFFRGDSVARREETPFRVGANRNRSHPPPRNSRGEGVCRGAWPSCSSESEVLISWYEDLHLLPP